jgi:hypothetical protein
MLEIKQLIKILQIDLNFMTRVIRNINAKDWKSDTSCITIEYRQEVINYQYKPIEFDVYGSVHLGNICSINVRH